MPHGEGRPRIARPQVQAVAVDPHRGGQAGIHAALNVCLQAVANVHCLRLHNMYRLIHALGAC